MKAPSPWCDDSPNITTTSPSRRSWPNRNAAPPPGCPSPEPAWRSCAPTTTSPSISRHRGPMSDHTTKMSSWSPSPKLNGSSRSAGPRSTAGSAMASSPPNRSHPAPPGASASTRRCVTASKPEAPEGWLSLDEAAKALGVARQTVLHKVQCGQLQAVHVNRGRRKGLRIQVEPDQAGLFDTADRRNAQC